MESFYTRCFGLEVLSRERAGSGSLRTARAARSLGARTQGVRRRGRPPRRAAGGDHSIYVEHPERNIVKVWSYFEDGGGQIEGLARLEA
jgi:hypothetical protein